MIEIILGMLQANNPLFIILAGLLIGLVHAFEPDHISAVSTQLLKNNNTSKRYNLRNLTIASSLKGMFWGIGHTSSIILIGLLIVGLSLKLPDDFFITAEIMVGILLIVLGVFTFTNKSILKQKHIHPHKHSDIAHTIIHTHTHTHNENHKHGHKAYLIGCIHGIAGSGTLVALAASTMNGIDMMIYFLILFGMGSIIGMTVTSGVLGLPIILLSKMSLVTKYLRYVIAGVSFIIGANIVFTVGVNQLFF